MCAPSAPVARRARVPVIAFSNDSGVAGNGIYILGITPSQSIDRVVRYARGRGAARFGALVPTGLYGQRAARRCLGRYAARAGRSVAIETFNRTVGGAAVGGDAA